MSSTVACCLLLLLAPRVVPGERLFDQDEDEVDSRASQRADWRLFSRSRPTAEQIKQGHAANGYYLAALAAVAHPHPEIIELAFLMKGQKSTSGKKVFQIRFLLNGAETIVAVDETVPVNATMSKKTPLRLFFSRTVDGSGIWPVLMEKGWAKVFGSYSATRSGKLDEALRAITHAPVDTFKVKDSGVWDILKRAISNAFPIAATPRRNSVGAVDEHAFAVIGVDEGSETVEVYSPWAAEKKGRRLMAEKKLGAQGTYKLSVSEFQEAFQSVAFARVRNGYRTSFKRIPVDEPVALQFTVTEKKASFTVQLEWPTAALVSTHGCRLRPRNVRLWVAKEGTRGWRYGELAPSGSHMRLDFDEGGAYFVYAYVSFTAPVVPQVAVNVYAGEDVDLLEMRTSPLLVGREILGWPCQFLVYSAENYTQRLVFEAVRFTVGGSPAWRSWGSQELIWVDLKENLAVAQALDRSLSEKLECRETVEYTAPEEEEWEPDKEEVENCLGFKLGQHVQYRAPDDVWTCGEIVDIDPEDGKVVHAGRAGEVDSVHCSDAASGGAIKQEEPCEYEENDQVELYKDGDWLSDTVEELGCGWVALANNGRVDCPHADLRYPHGCRFHAGEMVSLWIDWEERWRQAAVIKTDGDRATVAYHPHAQQALRCDDGGRLRKIRLCDKLLHGRLERLSQLNNVDEILEEGADSLFPPELDSIGPRTSGCEGSCDKFDSWGTLSDVLQ